MSRLDCATKIIDALQEKYNAAGTSGKRNEDTDSKHLRKLPGKKERIAVCVTENKTWTNEMAVIQSSVCQV
jgi:hypothetical protein